METFTVNGIKLAVAVHGTGPALLLVHGFPLDHTMWRAQIERFAPSHRVIAPDLRGFGASQATSGKVTMRQYADDLAALLDAMRISEPVAFCGLSMGGYIAFPFWQHHRDRVSKLILCDTRATADTDEARNTRLKTADLVQRSGTEFLAETMPARLFGSKGRGSEAEVQTREVIRRAHPIGVVAAQMGMAERADSTPLLESIDVPTLVVVGSEDLLTPPEEMQRIAQAIPHAIYVEVAGAGHMAPLEAPDEVNDALAQFLG